MECSQRARSPSWNSGQRAPPMSCHAIDQLTRRTAASSVLAQFGPMRYGQAMNQLSRCSASVAKYLRLPVSA
jgi:hypothetical protein